MAKKKSAAELKEEGASIGDQITTARKRAVNFALQIGKEGLVLETDLKKGPEILWRNAKKNGGGAKGAMGTMAVRGKVVELTTVDDSAPNQLPKLARRWLKERGLAYKVVMITPSGEVGDGEDDEDTDAADADTAAKTVDQEAQADTATAGGDADSGSDDAKQDGGGNEVSQQFEELRERIELAKTSTHKGAAKKVATLSETVEKLIGDNPDKAAGMLKLLTKTVEDAIAFGVEPTAEAPTADATSAGSDQAAPKEVDPAEQRRRADKLRDLNDRVEQLLMELA